MLSKRDEVPWSLRIVKPKKNNIQKTLKNWKFYKKNTKKKIVILKSWNIIHDKQKFSTNLSSNPNGGFFYPWGSKNLNNDHK